MKINGKDISEYGARQWNVVPALSSISNKSQWIAGAASPLLITSEIGMKKLKVSVMMEGAGRENIWNNAKKLVAELLSPAEIELEGFSNIFSMVLDNAASTELSLQKFHKATLELIGYEHGEEIVATGSGRQIYVENPGNTETPAIMEITPLIGKTSLTVRGIVRVRYTKEDKPIKINRLTKEKTIVLDGEKGLITEDGINKIGDVDIWGLPTLHPGRNLIQTDQADMELKIRFKPRYL